MTFGVMMRKSKNYDVEIKYMKYPNISGGYLEDGRKIEFKGGIIGQSVRVKSKRSNKDKVKAKYIELLENSTFENNEDTCLNPSICGGCAYQKLGYETELMIKQKLIKDLFEENNITYDNQIPINRSARLKGYRNKMEYTFGDFTKGGELVLGLHRENRFYEIVDTKSCNIIDEDFNIIRLAVQDYFRKKKTKFYHKKTKEGLLRHLVVRKAHRTGEIMILLVTTSDPSFDDIRKKLFQNYLLDINLSGQIVSIYHIINDSPADAVIPEKVNLLFGKSYITEQMLGLEFRISPFSFFQPNVFTAEKLYLKAIEMAGVDQNMDILDLYSGTGTITQLMARYAKSATGIEIVKEAVDKAIENANVNEIDNINFLCGDVLEEIEKVGNKYDAIILDPPRAGISEKSLEKILNIDCNKFVYISCNPKTQVENIKKFIDSGFKIENYEIFDQFPRSTHVESLALLIKE